MSPFDICDKKQINYIKTKTQITNRYIRMIFFTIIVHYRFVSNYVINLLQKPAHAYGLDSRLKTPSTCVYNNYFRTNTKIPKQKL